MATRIDLAPAGTITRTKAVHIGRFSIGLPLPPRTAVHRAADPA